MIYDEVKSWVKHVTKWSAMPGYISYSLSKQTFKNDPLFPHMLLMASYADHTHKAKNIRKWLASKYPAAIKMAGYPISKYDATYLFLIEHGYLFDLSKDIMHTHFRSSDHISGDNLTRLFVFPYDNNLYEISIDFKLSHVKKFSDYIDYRIELVRSIVCGIKSKLITNSTAHCLTSNIVDRTSANEVLSLFLSNRFEHLFLFLAFHDTIELKWLAHLLQRPVEDVVSNILAYQLDIPLNQTSTLVNFLGVEDIGTLIDTLAKQREVIFEEYADMDPDIVFL